MKKLPVVDAFENDCSNRMLMEIIINIIEADLSCEELGLFLEVRPYCTSEGKVVFGKYV